MRDKCKIGVYDYFEFSIKKLSYGNYKITPFKMYGEVIKADETSCTIVDCYDQEYRITWPRLTKFEKRIKPEDK